MKKKVAYFTNIAPHYREKLWLNMAKSSEYEFHFFFGNSIKGGIQEIDFQTDNWKLHQKLIHKIKNIRLKGRLVFQMGVFKNVLFGKWDTVVFLGDVNLISNWIGAIVARLRGINVVFWGHGLYDGDMKGINKHARLFFLSLANVHLVYGEWAKKQMIKNGVNEKSIKVIFNSLDYEESKSLRNHVIEKDFFFKNNFFKNQFPVLIYIGRLIPQKKIEWLIEAVSNLKDIGIDYNLMIVGDGSERSKLETMVSELKISAFFYGSNYNEEMNAKLLANADLCVSPGNVGLTAIHSMSYGTPVCTHNNFKKQGPEFEAIQEAITGCYYDWDERDISETIQKWFSYNYNREEVRANCYKIIDEKYNPDNQMIIMEKAFKV